MKPVSHWWLLCGCFCTFFSQADTDSYPIWTLLLNNSDFERRYVNDVPKFWYSKISNDAASLTPATDQYFTNALTIRGMAALRDGFVEKDGRLYGFRCGPDDVDERSGERCEAAPRSNRNNRSIKAVEYGYVASHELYTPYQDAGEGFVEAGREGYEHLANARWYDRPYAAWVYAGRQLRIRSSDHYIEHQLTLGMVGPAARGRAIQEFAHQYPFTGAYPIDGWESQVKNRLALQYTGKYVWHLMRARGRTGGLTLDHFPLIEMGSIVNRVGYGLEASLLVHGDTHCTVSFESGGLLYIDTVARQSVTVQQQLQVYVRRLEGYLRAENPVSQSLRLKILDLASELRRVLSSSPDNADGYRTLEWAQKRLAELNREAVDEVMSGCYLHDWSVRLVGSAAGHYVLSNYLLQGGIHVPEAVDPASPDPLMHAGGRRHVTMKRLIGSASIGMEVYSPWNVGFGARLHYRSEETLEQRQQHRWAEIEISGKSQWAAAAIPLLLGAISIYQYRNWP